MVMVISDKRTESGTIDADVYVCDGGNLTVHGLITGTLTVGMGGYADVFGMVGALVVRDAGSATLNGTCNGNATNLGGDLTVHGVVAGSIIGHAYT